MDRRLLTPAMRRMLLTAAVFVAAIFGTCSCSEAFAQTVDFGTQLDRVDGFGFSAAFGQANAVRALSLSQQKEILDLLFSREGREGREGGAGFNMLRLGINTDQDLEPAAPAKPSAKPQFVFDGSDGGQVWLAQQAQRYGVTNFTADAWSAPTFMKTKPVRSGGSLCGVVDTACPTGDWRAAYGRYVLQYVRFYREKGLSIRSLGFINEPDIHVSYASMDVSPAQVLDVLGVIGPVVRDSGLGLSLVCCDASTWESGRLYTAALEGNPQAARYVDIITAHEYGRHASQPLPTSKPVWMTEWSSGILNFEPRWDCGPCFGGPDGMYLAHDVLQAFTQGKVNAYLYWWAVAGGPAALIHTSGDGYVVAKRFYAIATISRFVRPGAFTVPVTVPDETLSAAGFRNPDGSGVLSLLNTAHVPRTVEFVVEGLSPGATAKTFLTDDGHSLAETDTAQLRGRVLSVELPPRSLCSITLGRPPAPI